jgi:hypothetical protein
MPANLITTVSVCFQADLGKSNPRLYTYLVPPTLHPKVSDVAIVFVRNRFECVPIIGLNPPLDPEARYEYKPIIDIVERHPMPDTDREPQ